MPNWFGVLKRHSQPTELAGNSQGRNFGDSPARPQRFLDNKRSRRAVRGGGGGWSQVLRAPARAVGLYRHLLPHPGKVRQINIGGDQAGGVLVCKARYDLAPRVHDL